MGNMKSRYLQYKVAGDKLFWAVTGLNPVTCDLSIYFCYFELDEQTNDKFNMYLWYLVGGGVILR